MHSEFIFGHISIPVGSTPLYFLHLYVLILFKIDVLVHVADSNVSLERDPDDGVGLPHGL